MLTASRIVRQLDELRPYEERGLVQIARLRNPLLTLMFKLFTYSGVGAAYFGVAGVIQVLHLAGIEVIPEQKKFLSCMVGALIAWVVSRQAKKTFARNRPHAAGALIKIPSCESFPSGHAAAAMSLFCALSLAGHPYAGYAGAWAGLVAFSRLYLGVHFPTDVAAGLLLGALCGNIGRFF